MKTLTPEHRHVLSTSFFFGQTDIKSMKRAQTRTRTRQRIDDTHTNVNTHVHAYRYIPPKQAHSDRCGDHIGKVVVAPERKDCQERRQRDHREEQLVDAGSTRFHALSRGFSLIAITSLPCFQNVHSPYPSVTCVSLFLRSIVHVPFLKIRMQPTLHESRSIA